MVVQDRMVLRQMVQCRAGAANMLAEADCAIVVVGVRASDTAVEDCSIVMSNMHNMADSLGLGSCWVQGRNRKAADGRTTEEFLRELLHFPENDLLEATLALGIPTGKRGPRDLASLDYGKVHWGVYGGKD